MLDLSKYQSIGEALRDALDQYANEVCLIEADRDREKERLTYRDFKERAHPLSKALQDGGFLAGSRASIVMTNQSKWLISAYAIFFAGGVLVPLDYKLTPDEQWQLLKHSGATVLITEYPIWRQSIRGPPCSSRNIRSGGNSALRLAASSRRTCERYWSQKRRRTEISRAQNAGKNFVEPANPYSSRANARTRPALSTLPERVAALKAA